MKLNQASWPSLENSELGLWLLGQPANDLPTQTSFIIHPHLSTLVNQIWYCCVIGINPWLFEKVKKFTDSSQNEESRDVYSRRKTPPSTLPGQTTAPNFRIHSQRRQWKSPRAPRSFRMPTGDLSTVWALRERGHTSGLRP